MFKTTSLLIHLNFRIYFMFYYAIPIDIGNDETSRNTSITVWIYNFLFWKNFLIGQVAKHKSIHRCLNLIQSWICKISVRFEIKRGKDSIAVHLLQIEKSRGKKLAAHGLVLPFRKPQLIFFIKSCSNDVLMVFASVSFLSYSIPHKIHVRPYCNAYRQRVGCF